MLFRFVKILRRAASRFHVQEFMRTENGPNHPFGNYVRRDYHAAEDHDDHKAYSFPITECAELCEISVVKFLKLVKRSGVNPVKGRGSKREFDAPAINAVNLLKTQLPGYKAAYIPGMSARGTKPKRRKPQEARI